MIIKEKGLVKIGDNAIPLKYISLKGYKAYPKRRLDVTAEKNSNGETIREMAKARPSTVTLELLPMSQTELNEVMDILHNGYMDEAQAKVQIEFFAPEYDRYFLETCYVPDFETPIDYIEGTEVYYDTITIEFISYGYIDEV